MKTKRPERSSSPSASRRTDEERVGVPSGDGAPAEEIRWPAGPRSPDLPVGEIHVWVLELDRGPASHLGLRTRLAPHERRRAYRVERAVGTRRSLVSRALLRELLGRYLGVAAREVDFRYGSAGKPALADPWRETGIRFNVSHSAGLALYAFARDVDVGVDLERVRPLPDLEALAARFFSEAETGALRHLEPELRLEAFYRGWTRKEAYVKALGDGLTHGLAGFDVTLAPDEEARLLRVGGVRGAARGWRLVHLEPAEGFVGALAIRNRASRIVRRWS